MPTSEIPTSVFAKDLAPGDRPTSGRAVLELTVLWNDTVLAVQHFPELRPITVGTDRRCDLRLAADVLPSSRFTLVDVEAEQLLVSCTQEMVLEVKDQQGTTCDGSSLAARGMALWRDDDVLQYPLRLHDRAVVQAGDLLFVAQLVSPARLARPRLEHIIDVYFTRVLGATLLAHLTLVVALLLTPFDLAPLPDALLSDHFIKLVLQMPKAEPPPLILRRSPAGSRHAGLEGSFGRRGARLHDTRMGYAKGPAVDTRKREDDMEVAARAGLLRVLQGELNTASVFGSGGLGGELERATNGLRGSGLGEASGTGGMSSRGFGPGGGGDSIGIGNIGGSSVGGPGEPGEVALPNNRPSYRVQGRPSVTRGCLSQQVVLRQLSRMQSQARYCYERGLQADPNLSGKVTTTFVIGPSGQVQEAQVVETSLKNVTVEACLLRSIRRLQFPPCAGGGVAEVTYPWLFESTGASGGRL